MMEKQDRKLNGTKEISAFVGLCWPTIRNFIEKCGFPARKVRGVWISTEQSIIRWYQKMATRETSIEAENEE